MNSFLIFGILFAALAFRWKEELIDSFLVFVTTGSAERGPGFLDNLNDENCKVLYDGIGACEDLVIDYENNVMYMASANVENRKKFWPPYAMFDYVSGRDEILLMDLATDTVKTTELVNFEGDLHHHGINLFIGSTGERLVWLVNHLESESEIVVFHHAEPSSNKLQFVHRFRHPLILTPNAVAPISETEFFVTNDHGHRRGIMRVVEDLLFLPIRSSYVSFCSIDLNGQTQCSVAIPNTKYSNGLRFIPDKKLLAVADTVEGTVSFYNVDETHNLHEAGSVATGAPIDNLSIDYNNNVIVNNMPIMRPFMDALGYRGIESPFMAQMITASSNYQQRQKLVKGNGEGLIGGISTLVYNSAAKKVYGGSIVQAGVLTCQL